jgi:putative transposon-encoded protein
MNPAMKVELEAYQVIEKEVKASGNSGRVYVPPEWIGKRVKILLLEPLDKEVKKGENVV